MNGEIMKIAFASSEAYPFAKTGGLGDVVGALPKALTELGCDVKVFLPKYSSIDHNKFDLSYCWPIGEMPIRVYGKVYNVNVFTSTLPNSEVTIYLIDSPEYFARPQIYTNDTDEDERFILFSKSVLEALQRLKWQPDVINCNDWQTGLIPLYIKDNYSWDKFFDPIAMVFTIHNIGYQGRFPKEALYKAEIKPELFYENSPVEIWNSVSFLKIGLMYADMINTVSQTYAQEIMTPEYGAGLEGVLHYRKDDFYGIVNGVDYHIWNPEDDRHIPFHYNRESLHRKIENKKFLMDAVRLPFHPEKPLIGIISRLVAQKGFDLIEKAFSELVNIDAQWVILGSGEDQYEEFFRRTAYYYPEKIYTYIGYNNELSHLVEAGADIFLMPSHYEPCGLNQIYSLRYGTVPVVRKTGGLADTVSDWHELMYKGDETGTGFTFNEYTPEALYSTLYRAVKTFDDKTTWQKIMYNGMTEDFSWEVSAKKYLELYRIAVQKRRG
jgi:starch synthase